MDGNPPARNPDSDNDPIDGAAALPQQPSHAKRVFDPLADLLSESPVREAGPEGRSRSDSGPDLDRPPSPPERPAAARKPVLEEQELPLRAPQLPLRAVRSPGQARRRRVGLFPNAVLSEGTRAQLWGTVLAASMVAASAVAWNIGVFTGTSARSVDQITLGGAGEPPAAPSSEIDDGSGGRSSARARWGGLGSVPTVPPESEPETRSELGAAARATTAAARRSSRRSTESPSSTTTDSVSSTGSTAPPPSLTSSTTSVTTADIETTITGSTSTSMQSTTTLSSMPSSSMPTSSMPSSSTTTSVATTMTTASTTSTVPGTDSSLGDG